MVIRTNDVPWYNSRLRCLKGKKYRLHREAKQSKRPNIWHRFREMCNKYISELRKAKAQSLSDLANKLSRHGEISPKFWWSLGKHFLGTTSDTKDSMPSLYVNNLPSSAQ